MKTIIMVLVWLFAAACSGTADEYTEIGELEQGFRGKETPNFQYGTRTGSTKQRCDKTTAGQVCAIPPSKTLTYCIHLGTAIGGPDSQSFVGTQNARVSSIIEGFDAISDFVLTPTATQDCFFSPGNMSIFKGPAGSAGTGSGDVKDYANTSMSSMTGLTEGAGVVGSYQTWGHCSWNIDVDDILAKGTSSTQDNNGLDHAAAHSLMVCLGIGGRTGDGGRASRNLFNPASTAVVVSNGESCQLQGFTLSDPGQFNLNPDCASD